MSRLTVGKLRGLQQVANAKGILTVCAIDHRESLRQALNAKKPETVSYQQMVDFKLDLVGVIAPLASAVLLDQSSAPVRLSLQVDCPDKPDSSLVQKRPVIPAIARQELLHYYRIGM